MASEAEIRLRERLSKLGSMKLLRGAKLSGELDRLQEQLERLQEEPCDRGHLAIGRARDVTRIGRTPSTTSSASSRTSSSCTAIAAGRTTTPS
jgi:hypothetical protein